MNLVYKTSESTTKPDVVHKEAKTVYLRKNITEATRTTEDGEKTKYYTYQEAKLTPAEFDDYSAALIISAQQSSDDSQLILMDALASLYEMIALGT